MVLCLITFPSIEMWCALFSLEDVAHFRRFEETFISVSNVCPCHCLVVHQVCKVSCGTAYVLAKIRQCSHLFHFRVTTLTCLVVLKPDLI